MNSKDFQYRNKNQMQTEGQGKDIKVLNLYKIKKEIKFLIRDFNQSRILALNCAKFSQTNDKCT